MRAAFMTAHGDNSVVVIGERPDPVAAEGDILVRMKAATLNRVDLYMRDSGAGITHTLPQILGVDGSGIVDAIAAEESSLKPGQAVVLYPAITCGRCDYCLRGETLFCLSIRYLGEHRDGSLCELVSVPAANVFPLPNDLDFPAGAALGVTYLTAWRMLFSRARFVSGESVLIFGIGGGVSLAALQLAKMAGAQTIVTSRSDEKLAQALEAGANWGLNASTDIAASVMEITDGRGVDIVIENVGEQVWPIALRSVARGGRIVTCGATSGDQPSAELRRMFVRQISVLGSTLGTREEFKALLQCCSSGALKPIIGNVRPLWALHGGLSALEAGEHFGKIAIGIDEGARAETLLRSSSPEWDTENPGSGRLMPPITLDMNRSQ